MISTAFCPKCRTERKVRVIIKPQGEDGLGRGQFVMAITECTVCGLDLSLRTYFDDGVKA